MKSVDVRVKYIEFFSNRGHKEIPSAKLVPENDPTTLFTSSGMQPLIPYLLGQKHPLGTRLVDSQKSFRAQDIDEVGDNRHTTFFEMLGNWSLGDYFKKEQLSWIWEFLTRELGLPKEKLFVSVFEGSVDVPRDEESAGIWKSLGVPEDRIFYYGVKKNWWSRSGEPEKMPPGEPGGPDSEVFFDFGTLHDPTFGATCHPNCDCGRFMEIANSVFMQYQKKEEGTLVELAQKNVDFGGGLERMLAASNNDPDVFKTDIFIETIRFIEQLSKKTYEKHTKETHAMRIIADHMRASVFLVSDGVIPSNQKQGYVLRKLLRRSIVVFSHLCDVNTREFLDTYALGHIVDAIIQPYKSAYPDLVVQKDAINSVIEDEWYRFKRNMHTAYPELMKLMSAPGEMISGEDAFNMLETHGILPAVLEEVAQKSHKKVDWDTFKVLQKKHQELSRTAAAGMFKGGLADHSEQTTRLHTAHHLLLVSLQKSVDASIKQRGSNITAERLRMDFNFARKLTPAELTKIETMVNKTIKEDLPVTRVEMDRVEGEKIGAQMEFGAKYPDRVSVYFVGDQKQYFSAEFCGGPHVTHTGALGIFKILKEESAGAGVRRIYATLE